jgi:hypothetical protein
VSGRHEVRAQSRDVEALGGGRELPEPARSAMRASDGTRFVGFWEAMARQELLADPTLLDENG